VRICGIFQRSRAQTVAKAAATQWLVRPQQKSAEQAGRIAGVLALFRDPLTSIIDEDTMRCATSLAKFFLEEYRRLLENSAQDEAVEDAKALLDWVHGQGNESPWYGKNEAGQAGWLLSHRDIKRGAPRAFRKTRKNQFADQRLENALTVLGIDHEVKRHFGGNDGKRVVVFFPAVA
jgi:hypothetical protein